MSNPRVPPLDDRLRDMEIQAEDTVDQLGQLDYAARMDTLAREWGEMKMASKLWRVSDDARNLMLRVYAEAVFRLLAE